MSKHILLVAGIALLCSFCNTVWGQNYNMPGGTVSTCSGNFYDTGGGAGSYANNQDITTVLFPSTAGSYMSVNFTSISLHAGYDFLYIYDGNSTAAPLMGIYTGTASPGLIKASTINTTGCITFRFVSNSWGTDVGWAATLSCSATPGTPRIAAQNGTFSACSGVFTDPGGNADYQANTNVTTTLCPSAPGQYVSVSFSSFLLDYDFKDWLYVYDGNSTSAPLIGMYSNSSLPGMATTPGVITASSDNPTGCLTFRFTSDTWDVFAGWQATISCTSTPATPSYAISPGTVTTCGASFTDVGGATNDYIGPLDITNTFCPGTPGQAIRVSFTSLSMSMNSREDCLYIYDGNSTSAPLIAICSDNLNPGTFTASTNNPTGCLTFRLITDTWNQHAGWVATISCVAPGVPSITMNNTTVNLCNATFTDDGGPNGNYYFNMSSQVISRQTFCPTSASSFMSAAFSSFSTEGSIDVLRAYDGTSTAAPLLGTWFGNASPGTVNATGSNASGCLTFEYTNSSWTATAGWVAAITCVSTLPVEFVSFSGEWVNGDVLLHWSTATESNNDHFIVERSSDGEHFMAIGEVDGNGNTSFMSYYSFLDEYPLDITAYYRIKQVDVNGDYDYSSTIAMEKSSVKDELSTLHPNPAADHVVLVMDLEEDGAREIMIINSLGMEAGRTTMQLVKGRNEIEYPLVMLAPGAYHLVVRDPVSGRTTNHRLVKL